MEKIPFFKKILMSVKDLDKYNILINEKLRRSIFYLLELMLIFAIIVTLAVTYKIDKLVNEATEYTKDNISEFKINENGLDVEGDAPVVAENKNIVQFKIVLDDVNEEKDNYQEDIDNYNGNLILLLKNKVVIISGGQQIERSYKELLSNSELNTSEISKTSLINLIEENRMQIDFAIFASMFGITYIIYTVSTIIDALALSLLVIIISKMAKIPLKYSQCITIAISALTLPIILNLIYNCANILANFYMSYFQIMYTLISYVYIVAVILIMRSDLVKKRQLIKATIEVKKLEQEQENKETKEEKKEDENKKNKKKDNDKEENDEEDDKLSDNKKDTLGKVKGKIKNKLNEDKDKPEPQANIK